MRTVFTEIFANGHIYLWLYSYFLAVVIAEVIFENEKFSRVLGRIGAGILILFVGLRWETGTDWEAYLNIFYTNTGSSDYDIAVFGIDTGYLLLNKTIYALSSDYTSFLVVDAFISIAAVYYFIEKSTRYPNMGVYLFYTSYVITHFMGSNRRMLAIGLVCLGFLYLKRGLPLARGFLRWTMPFALGASFHRTALMALPGLVVSRRAWPAPLVLGGLGACVVLGVSGAPFAALEGLGSLLVQFAHVTIVEKLLFYTSGGEAQSIADYDVMGQALLGIAKRSTVLVVFIGFMIWGKPDQYAQRLYNIYVLGCAIYFLMIGSPVFQVASTYYSIVEVALLPITFSQMGQFKFLYILYLAAIPFLLMASALSPYLELYVPYHSIFSTY